MILVLLGPTASGKSALAIELAQKIGGEIVNADAFQVYKDFPIATASPKEEEKRMVPHHLYNFVPSDVSYDIAQYQKDVRKVLDDLLKEGKTPILVGGSGLYIRSALYDYDLGVDTSNVDMSPYEKYSDIALHEVLEKLDWTEAQKIPYQNRRRVLRSIALCLAAKESKTSLLSKQSHKPIYDCQFFRLSPSRDFLYERIDKRVEEMFQEGVVEEVLPKIEGVEDIKGAYQAIGVKEFFLYRNKLLSLSETKEKIKLDTRHYVKRQETFFRHQFESAIVNSLSEVLDVIQNR